MNNKVQVKSGILNDTLIPNDAIVVIEDYDKQERVIPQQEMIDSNKDLNRLFRLVHGCSLRCYCKTARKSERMYAFVKTDDEQQTFAVIKTLEERLKEVKEIKNKTIYMQRISFDTYDCGKAMLEKLDMKAVYFTGEQKPVPKGEKYLFRIDFTPNDLFEHCASRIKGQDNELAKAVYLIWDFIHSAALGINKPAQNWILTAPSGMGKTEFYRCIADFMLEHNIPVPVIRRDLNDYTETGFKGKEITELPEEIKSYNQKSYIDCATAICFLDEADKRMMPSYGSNNVNINAAIQSNMLTLIEGTKIEDFDSSKTMFVFLGAFQYLRDRKQKESKLLRSGFRKGSGQVNESDAFYDDIELNDMIEQGMLEELAGRITSVINFHKISERQMRKIIRDKAAQIGKELGCPIRITDKGLKELMEIAYTNLGVRKPMNVIRELALSVIAHQTIFGDTDNDISEIVISGLEKVRLKKANHSEKEPQKISQERTCESA